MYFSAIFFIKKKTTKKQNRCELKKKAADNCVKISKVIWNISKEMLIFMKLSNSINVQIILKAVFSAIYDNNNNKNK